MGCFGRACGRNAHTRCGLGILLVPAVKISGVSGRPSQDTAAWLLFTLLLRRP